MTFSGALVSLLVILRPPKLPLKRPLPDSYGFERLHYSFTGLYQAR
jgi:hypothetical protein